MKVIINKYTWIGFLLAVLAACVPQTQTELGSPTILPTATGEMLDTAVPPSATPMPTDTPQPAPATQTLQPTEEVLEMTPVTNEQSPIPAGSESLVALVVQDLAQRQKISEDQISVISFETKVWPDGAYGCPQPGMMYIQVLTEGYLIQLQVGDELFNYHGGEGREPFLCVEENRDK